MIWQACVVSSGLFAVAAFYLGRWTAIRDARELHESAMQNYDDPQCMPWSGNGTTEK